MPLAAFPLIPGCAENGPEQSRARLHLARRSEPLTARTVLRRSIMRGKAARNLRNEPENNLTRRGRISRPVTLDTNEYETGIKVSDEQLDEIQLRRHKVHPAWNYTISPRRPLIF